MAYPDFGGGAAYGDAYEQGAGFYAAGAENESPNKGGKSSKSGQPVIPVTICQINVLMRETGGEGSFTLDVRFGRIAALCRVLILYRRGVMSATSLWLAGW